MPTTADKGLFPASRVTRIRRRRPAQEAAGAWSWGLQLLGETDHTETADLDRLGDAAEAAVEHLDTLICRSPGAISLRHADAVEVLGQIRRGLWDHGAVIIPGQLIGDHRGDLLCWIARADYGHWSAPTSIDLPHAA